MDFLKFSHLSVKEVLDQLHSSVTGLTSDEAHHRLQTYGPNEIKSKNTTAIAIFLRQFQSPFLYLLMGAAVISFLVAEKIDAFMIVLFISINALLGFYQEYRSEQAIKLLKQFIVTQAKVIRNGKETITAHSDLVPGDVILLTPGDIIPADVRFLSTEDVLVDESILTGESVPVKKYSTPLSATRIQDATNSGFSGTTIISGEGQAIVIATGKSTQIGDIARLTSSTNRVSSFEKELGKFSVFILRLVGITLVFIFVAHYFIKGSHANLPELLVFSIALAVSVVPEALPVVTLFSLSRGALRLAKHKVVVKRLASIEDLGGIEILCSDKTGTLTQNKLRIENTYNVGNKDFLSIVSAFSQSSEKHDPFTIAVMDSASSEGQSEVKDELPFDPERRRSSIIISSGKKDILLSRGAAEAILPLCTSLSAPQKASIQSWIAEEGEKGNRILAFAQKELSLKKDRDILQEEKSLSLIGLVSFSDPLKDTAKASIKKARELGITLKILTGDSKEVAGAIGYQIGLIGDRKDVITGDDLDKLEGEKRAEVIQNHSIFARVTPQQKYMIIQQLQIKNTVGFLGEGINDAPALKIADVGIVVQGASDVAREAADIVLLQKSLEVIVDGIEEGREVFMNTLKYIRATLSSNFGNFYAVAISSLIIPFLPMLPLQILLLNLLSDFPMIAVATDSVDEQELQKPRGYDIKDIALIATILGVVSTFFDFIFFGLYHGISPEVLHTNWFIGSVLTELVFLFSIRTRLPFFKAKPPSFPLLFITILAFVITIIIPFTQLGRTTFQFVQPTLHDLIQILIIVILYFVTTESVKLLYYHFSTRILPHTKAEQIRRHTNSPQST